MALEVELHGLQCLYLLLGVLAFLLMLFLMVLVLHLQPVIVQLELNDLFIKELVSPVQLVVAALHHL